MIATGCGAVSATLTAAVLALGSLVIPGDDPCWDTAWRCRDVNQVRAQHDRAPLDQTGELQHAAGAWADEMAGDGVLAHDPQPEASEIVGVGPDWPTVLAAFMDSPHHREILLGRYERVGIGVQRVDGWLYVVVRFR